MSHTVIGVLVMLLSTSTMNVAAVLQKKAVDGLPPLDGQPVLASLKALGGSTLWIVGLVMGVVAVVMNMIALGLADISVIQPLNGFGLVVLAMTSYFYLGERLTKLTVVGIVMVIAGVAAIGASAAESRVFVDADEIFGSYSHSWAVATFMTAVALILLLWSAARRLQRAAGVLYALVAAFCSVVGLTFSKGAFGLFAIEGIGPALGHGPEYLLLALVLFFCTVAMMFQQLSFQKGRAVVVTPVYVAGQVVLPIAMGSFVFGERVTLFAAAAVVAIITGVVFLGLRNEVKSTRVRPAEDDGG
jgi:drug/metabolite transporter (DMT)-like permease